jgi:hypothetical protein
MNRIEPPRRPLILTLSFHLVGNGVDVQQFKLANSAIEDTLLKGQQPALVDLKAARVAVVEVTHEGVKYNFNATKVAADQVHPFSTPLSHLNTRCESNS